MGIKIEVMGIRPLSAGSLKGFASVRIADKLIINSCRIVHEQGKRPWVSLPQETYEDKETGKKKYSPIVEIPDEWKSRIQELVLSEYHDTLNENQDSRGEF